MVVFENCGMQFPVEFQLKGCRVPEESLFEDIDKPDKMRAKRRVAGNHEPSNQYK